MREPSIPRGPNARLPRDDTLKQTAGYLAMSIVAIAALGLVYLLVQELYPRDPALVPAQTSAPAPPPIDEAQLARAITAGVVAAIGSPAPLRGEIVMLEPTPTATPAKPTAIPTTGPMTCPDNPNVLPAGSICLGKSPLPTQTPMPTCLVPPTDRVVCMVRPGDTPVPLLPTMVPELEGDHTR